MRKEIILIITRYVKPEITLLLSTKLWKCKLSPQLKSFFNQRLDLEPTAIFHNLDWSRNFSHNTWKPTKEIYALQCQQFFVDSSRIKIGCISHSCCFAGGLWLCTTKIIDWHGAGGDLRGVDDEMLGARLSHGGPGVWQHDCGPCLLPSRRNLQPAGGQVFETSASPRLPPLWGLVE